MLTIVYCNIPLNTRSTSLIPPLCVSMNVSSFVQERLQSPIAALYQKWHGAAAPIYQILPKRKVKTY